MTKDELIAHARARLELERCPRCQSADLEITADPPRIACAAGCEQVAEAVHEIALRLTGDGVKPQREALVSVAVAAQRAARTRKSSSAMPPRDQGPAHARIAMSSIAPRAVDWLWAGRIPLASVVSIDGLPASGKSSLATEIVSCGTTGRALYGAAARPARSAIWIGHEEGLATALRPRLDASGADAARVYVYQCPPSFPADYEWLAREIRDTSAAIVVIDPIDAYIDFGARGDSHRNGDVRARLVGLGAVAEKSRATIVMIRHWRKSGGTHALYRAAGSIAYSALARATISVMADPANPHRRIAAWSKLSDAPEPTSIAFRLGDDRRVEWIGEDPRSATELMAALDAAASGRGSRTGNTTVTTEAEEWLMSELEGPGAVPVADLKQRAAGAGLAWRTIERAKERLGAQGLKVQVRRESDGKTGAGRWFWRAPRAGRQRGGEEDQEESKTAKQMHLAVLGEVNSDAAPKSAPPKGLGRASKNANPKTANVSLAALDLVTDERADALAEGPTHA